MYFGCAFHIMICRFLDLSNTSLTAPGPARMRGGGAPQARTFGVSRIVSYQLLPSERALERDQGPSAEERGKASRLVDGHLAKLILNLIKACLGSSILVSSALACCARLECTCMHRIDSVHVCLNIGLVERPRGHFGSQVSVFAWRLPDCFFRGRERVHLFPHWQMLLRAGGFVVHGSVGPVCVFRSLCSAQQNARARARAHALTHIAQDHIKEDSWDPRSFLHLLLLPHTHTHHTRTHTHKYTYVTLHEQDHLQENSLDPRSLLLLLLLPSPFGVHCHHAGAYVCTQAHTHTHTHSLSLV